MKVSLNWARQFTDIDLSTEELVKLATERLGGVEGYDELGKHYEGIVVAKIVSCEKHSNADKLNICKVDDGGVVKDVARDESGHVQVVCGAPNAREGLLVAWIPPQAIVPASYGEKELFVLEARDLRGELSNGMLASPRELGLNDDHEGILEITEEVSLGTPFKDLYGLDDVIIEIENKMFTHRPDGFGQLGVAREIAGIQHKAFKSPDWYVNKEYEKWNIKNEENASLEVDNQIPGLCSRYMAVVIDNIEVKPSPTWLQSYLKRVGVRPINNVVDITNYMMLETAQPLHAFDFDKIAKDGRVDITVRRPKDGEKMTLLDSKTIEPHKDAVLICNPDGPIALGGVMGGANSEIDASTKRIILECATFDMYNIRKTSMIHGLFTDAVTRFTKGQPAAQLAPVLHKTVQMFNEIVGAHVSSGLTDTNSNPQVNQPVSTTAKFINDRLGSDLSVEEITTLLTNVEFSVAENDEALTITAPFWRTDIEIAEDIVEEVGRLYGFNRLPIELPSRSIAPVKPEAKLALKQQIRETLSRAGANEVLTYSFVHGNLLEKVGQKSENSYAIRNALSPDLQYYRQTLTPSLLDLVHSNIKAGFNEFAIFEPNKTHNKVHGNDEEGLPGELNMIALSYASNEPSATGSAYYMARRYLDYIASALGFTLIYVPLEQEPGFPVTASFDYQRSALVTIKEVDVFLGIVGEYKTEVAKNLKLPVQSAGFEIGLDALLEAVQKLPESNYRALSKYPSTEQDITLRVESTVSFAQLEACLRDYLQTVDFQWTLQPMGIFQKEADTKKNITFRLSLADTQRTLVTSEVNELIKHLTWQAHEALQAEHV